MAGGNTYFFNRIGKTKCHLMTLLFITHNINIVFHTSILFLLWLHYQFIIHNAVFFSWHCPGQYSAPFPTRKGIYFSLIKKKIPSNFFIIFIFFWNWEFDLQFRFWIGSVCIGFGFLFRPFSAYLTGPIVGPIPHAKYEYFFPNSLFRKKCLMTYDY